MNAVEELRLHVGALAKAVTKTKSHSQFFASQSGYIERLQELVRDLADRDRPELLVIARRLDGFFSQWRSSDGAYFPPREAADSDPTMSRILGLASSIADMSTEQFASLRSASISELATAPVHRAPTPLETVTRLVDRFHRVARQLRARHDNRPTLSIDDEYDVQDLLHAMLRIHFNDVRAEEWTGSYAGKSARMDFLLKEEKLVLEIKMTRDGLNEKKVGDELIVDIGRYATHQDCKTLVCFVYDPTGRIGNPTGLERDLSRTTEDGLTVVVIVAPKG